MIPNMVSRLYVWVRSPKASLHWLRDHLWPREPQRDVGRTRAIWLVAVHVLRRWWHDRGPTLAAALALDTLLSLVPFLGVVLLALGLMQENAGNALVLELAQMLVPDRSRAVEVTNAVLALARNMTVARLGLWGFLGALGVAYLLFFTLEGTMNEIWRVPRTRSVVARFTMFYTLATLGPLVALYSFAQPMGSRLTHVVLVTPMLTTSLALVLMNRLVPNTSVRWLPAVIGGLVSGLLFEFGKQAFGAYVSLIAYSTYEGLYGSLAIWPVLVVWTYVSWMVVLLGVEVTYVVQHRRNLALEGWVTPRTSGEPTILEDPGRWGATVLLFVCDRYDHVGAATTLDDIAERFHIGKTRAGLIARRLERYGFLLETGNADVAYLPSRPLDHIELREVLQAFELTVEPHLRQTDILSDVFVRLDASMAEITSNTTYQDLIAHARKRRQTASREK